MQMVITTIKLKPKAVDACASLFEKSNPGLVRAEPDWLSARMVIDRETNTMIVMALWRNAASYQALRSSSSFQSVMKQFGEFFASPPEIVITDVLVSMTLETI